MRFYSVFLVTFFLFFQNYSISQEKIAILIGNENYKIGQLKNPINDIEALKKTLNKNGYKTYMFYNLTDSEFNRYFIDTIREIFKSAKSTKLFFHYSGHGIQIENLNYFVPIDLPEKITFQSDFKRNCFSLNDLFDVINDLNQKNKIEVSGLISIDACRDNPLKMDGKLQGLAKNELLNYISRKFEILYAVGPGETTSDGKFDTSPFVRGLIKGIESCDDLIELNNKIKFEYISEDINKTPYHDGHLNFSFCESKSNNTKFWIAKYDTILKSINNDFKKQKYFDVLNKAELIYSIDSDTNIIFKNEEFLRCALNVAESHHRLNNIEIAKKQLDRLIRQALKLEYFDLYKDAYLYLQIIYIEEREHAKLYDLRKQYLFQVIKKNEVLEIATTYDKIAGDFESRKMQDSAIFYYLKAKKIIDTMSINSEKSTIQISLIYADIGKCYSYGSCKNLKKANENIDKSLSLNVYDIKLHLDVLIVKIKLQLEEESSRDNNNQLLSNLNKLKTEIIKEKDSIHMLHELDLLFEFYNKNEKKDSLLKINKKINQLIFQNNRAEILSDSTQYKCLDKTCGYDIREISIITKKGTLPVLFFDVNKNMIYDDNDFMIIPDNALNLNQQENKLSSNESILNVGSREIKNAKNLGFYEILKINKKSDAIKPDTSILKNAICFAFPEGDNVNWKFRIDCSEFKSLNSKIFFGLEYTKIEQKNNIILVDDILRFTPVFPVNNENVTFSMSTLEDN